MKKKRRHIDNHRQDNHHLCYQKNRWATGYQKELRLFPYCIVLIPKNTLHRAIHSAVEHVPEPRGVNAKAALGQLELLFEQGAIALDDPIEKRLELLAALFDCCEQPTADGFRAQLAVVHKFKKPP